MIPENRGSKLGAKIGMGVWVTLVLVFTLAPPLGSGEILFLLFEHHHLQYYLEFSSLVFHLSRAKSIVLFNITATILNIFTILSVMYITRAVFSSVLMARILVRVRHWPRRGSY